MPYFRFEDMVSADRLVRARQVGNVVNSRSRPTFRDRHIERRRTNEDRFARFARLLNDPRVNARSLACHGPHDGTCIPALEREVSHAQWGIRQRHRRLGAAHMPTQLNIPIHPESVRAGLKPTRTPSAMAVRHPTRATSSMPPSPPCLMRFTKHDVETCAQDHEHRDGERQ